MHRILLPLLAVVLAGCGGDPPPLDMATTPEQSRAAFVGALDAWKAGATPESLTAKNPSVYLADENFARGVKLLDYKLEGDPVVVGTGITYVVTLTLQDGAKAANTRKLAYRVVTQPNISISKEDSMP